MARRPSVRYFASRNAYYCQLNGQQHKLSTGPDDFPNGPTYNAAVKAFQQLTELASVAVEQDRSPVRAILETYMTHVSATRSPSTYRLAKAAFLPFSDAYGETPVGRLTPADIDSFLAKMQQPRKHGLPNHAPCKWGSCSIRLFLKNLSAALNWSVKRGYIQKNPVAGYEMPAAKNRSALCLITPEDHQAALAACRKGTLRQMLIALENTGARPGELMAADCKDFDPGRGAIIYRGDDKRREDDFRHKSAGHCKDRVIYFTGDALEMVRELVRKNRTGPIFRGRYGARWGQGVLNRRFRQVRAKIGVPDFIPYGYRHTLATRWLEGGESIDLLAELLGNTPETIRRYYRHISPDSPAVLEALQRFRGGK